jgi:parallel beta-helix repeat protein
VAGSSGPDDPEENFTSIQAAIDAAQPGDTVFVYNGTYYGNLVVNKTINLIGEDRNSTIINFMGGEDVIYVSSNWVNITGFTINESGATTLVAGIKLDNIHYCRIAYNNISVDNKFGIFLDSSSNNLIKGNNASSSWVDGIYLQSSSNNTITDNIVLDNGGGIYLASSSNNIITGNFVLNNDMGISLFSSSNNNICHHNYIDNTDQAYDGTNNGNQWDNGYPWGGNYWSDYSGFDNFKGPFQNIPGKDSIGDMPYIIDTDSQDNYPLMAPYKPLENFTVLKHGWNLISIPLVQEEQNLTRVLGSIDGWYDAVQWYNITDISDPWKHCKLGKPFGNDLYELNEFMSFWIHITQPGDTIFVYNGTQPIVNQTISLSPGWNLVGYPSMTAKNRTDALNNIDFISDVDAIWTYNATTQKWKEITASDNFEVGRGYWVHSKVTKIWIVPL